MEKWLKVCGGEGVDGKRVGLVDGRRKEEMDFESEWGNDFRELIEKWGGLMGGRREDRLKNI